MVTEAAIRDALRSVQDPDLHQDIEALGFVQDVVVDGTRVAFTVELTTPACPVKDVLRQQAHDAVAALEGVSSVDVRMTARTRAHAAVGGAAALADVVHVVLVGAGKGGVGKSTTTVALARALAATGARVAMLDADIHGPSLVTLTGADVPIPGDGRHTPPEVDGIAVVSMGMFMPAARATLLRGPRVTALLQQLVDGFAWGARDYLLVDCPPGTGDVHLTLAQLAPVSGAVLVTTPQDLAVDDTRRAATMYRTLGVPVLGVIETMAGFVCPSCDALHPLFGEGGGAALAGDLGVPLLGQIPLDPGLRSHPERPGPGVAAFAEAAGQLARRLSVVQARAGDVLETFELDWRDAG